MAKQVFINLAVKDLNKSMNFYKAMGLVNNPQFSDETAKCMVWSENIFVMIMTHDKFNGFATKPIPDMEKCCAAIYSLSVDNLDEVNRIMSNALASGGSEPTEMKDHGFMQQRTLEDPDGYTWEVFCMDMSKFPVQA
jgi:hypothetical protein